MTKRTSRSKRARQNLRVTTFCIAECLRTLGQHGRRAVATGTRLCKNVLHILSVRDKLVKMRVNVAIEMVRYQTWVSRRLAREMIRALLQFYSPRAAKRIVAFL